MKELGQQTQQGYLRMRLIQSLEIITPEDGLVLFIKLCLFYFILIFLILF